MPDLRKTREWFANYMNEGLEYGESGVLVPRSEIIRDLQARGLSQQQIGLYMFGLESGQRSRHESEQLRLKIIQLIEQKRRKDMQTKSFKFALGEIVKDRITGFTRVVMGNTCYLTGCVHCALQATELNKDGVPGEWVWLDESRLVATGESIEGTGIQEPQKTAGGPQPNAPQM